MLLVRDMELTFDILDYIFGLLRSNPESLVQCSKAHRFVSWNSQQTLLYHIVIHLLGDRPTATSARLGYNLTLPHLVNLLSHKPQLVNNVRVLQIRSNGYGHTPLSQKDSIKKVAPLLPKFSALESIIFIAHGMT